MLTQLAIVQNLFWALCLSLSYIGRMANVKDEIFFLRAPKNTLWSETFFQCPAHSNGRRLRSGDKNTVREGSRLWSFAQYSCLAQIPILFRSTPWGHRWLSLTRTKSPLTFLTKDPVLTPTGKQVQVLFSQLDLRQSFLASLDHTLPCSMNCKFFASYFKDNIEPTS